MAAGQLFQTIRQGPAVGDHPSRRWPQASRQHHGGDIFEGTFEQPWPPSLNWINVHVPLSAALAGSPAAAGFGGLLKVFGEAYLLVLT